MDGNNWYILVYCDLASFLNLIHFQDSISYEGGCFLILLPLRIAILSDRMATLEGWKSGTCTGGRLECMEIHYPLQTRPHLFAIQNVPEKFPIDILDRSIFFSNRSAEEATSLHALGPLWTVWQSAWKPGRS